MADSLLSVKQTKKHRLEMQDRASLSVSGIDDVISYDENCIVLATVCGILSIDGAEMRIVNLDVEKGDIEISGTVNGMIYPENARKSTGLFRSKRK